MATKSSNTSVRLLHPTEAIPRTLETRAHTSQARLERSSTFHLCHERSPVLIVSVDCVMGKIDVRRSPGWRRIIRSSPEVRCFVRTAKEAPRRLGEFSINAGNGCVIQANVRYRLQFLGTFWVDRGFAPREAHMPRFHFEIVASYTLEDPFGMELPTKQHAKGVAEEIAKQIAADVDDGSPMDVVVKTDEGDEIFKTPIRAAHF